MWQARMDEMDRMDDMDRSVLLCRFRRSIQSMPSVGPHFSSQTLSKRQAL
jgi:hypothetical protein